MKQISMRYPGGKPKALTLSYDDGVEQDIELVAIMQKYGIVGTFNLNTEGFSPEGTTFPKGHIHRRMTEHRAVELFKNSGMEVAVHSLTHPWLEKLPPVSALWEVLGDRKNLETLFGTLVHGMAYPYGTFSDAVVEQLRSAGIWYARTVVSTHSFDQPTDWLRLPATCHHKDSKLMELAQRFVSGSPETDPWLFYLWGHSYEFEVDDNWQVIRGFFEAVSGREDVWYATNIDVYDYTKAYESLDFSTDFSLAYNPSALPVWIMCDGEIKRIKSGELVRL